MKSRVDTIHFGFLEKLVKLFQIFSDIFDDLEASNVPTLHKAVPAYMILKQELTPAEISGDSDSDLPQDEVEAALN